jgi:hypothetical protein
MSNMSYCRFENTNSDLGDCFDALEELVNGEEDERGRLPSPLSSDELSAAKSLVDKCQQIIQLLADYSDQEAMEGDFSDALDRLNEDAQHLKDAAKGDEA